MTKDLTVGSPLKVIFDFAVPVFFGYLFQQFYNLVDTIIVGQFLGVSALAAVGSTGSLNFMIIGFCMGLCSGFAIPVAQKFGAKDFCGMRQFVFNSAVLGGIFAIVLTAVTVIFCRPLLLLLKTPVFLIQSQNFKFSVHIKKTDYSGNSLAYYGRIGSTGNSPAKAGNKNQIENNI